MIHKTFILLQRNIQKALATDADIVKLNSKIYDKIPENAETPFIYIGDYKIQQNSSFNIDIVDIDYFVNFSFINQDKKQIVIVNDKIYDVFVKTRTHNNSFYKILKVQQISLEQKLENDYETETYQHHYRISMRIKEAKLYDDVFPVSS